MVIASPGDKLVLKRAGRFSRNKGYTWAPVVRPHTAGQFEAMANLAETAAQARDRGLINIDGLPGAAGFVKATLSGKTTEPNRYAREAARRQASHAAVPQKVQALRARAQALRSGAGGASPFPTL